MRRTRCAQVESRGDKARASTTALRAFLVGCICYLSTETGFALKFPPHFISPLWPTGAILFSVLVVAPVRQWWAYVFAAYFTSVVNDVRAGFPLSAPLFISAGVIEILIAAIGVRRFANGIHAFETLRGLKIYLAIGVVLAPCISACIAAFASVTNYWFYWRVWFLSEALGMLVLAPAILTWIAIFRSDDRYFSVARGVEAGMIGFGLLIIGLLVFNWPRATGSNLPAMVYLPLPLLLWAAVRLGPAGVNTSLLIVASLSIFGAVDARGPFATSQLSDNVLALQLFLVTFSLPFMFLAALINERARYEVILRDRQREQIVLTGKLLLAQETERRRIARELHDGLSQDLSLLSVEVDLLSQRPPTTSDELRQRMQQLTSQIKQLSSTVHDLSHQLHPAKLEQLGLVAAVRGLCQEMSASHNIAIDFNSPSLSIEIPNDSALCLYRIAQEALQNIIKHSGAGRVGVTFIASNGTITLNVVDDGTGFDPEAANCREGLGLVSMRERLRAVGGKIAIDSKPQGGTHIGVQIPHK